MHPRQHRQSEAAWQLVAALHRLPELSTEERRMLRNNRGSVRRQGAVGDDRIELNSQDTQGKETRWSFNDIPPDSFVFRDEVSLDRGKTWRLREKDHLKRRGSGTGSLTIE